MAYSRVTISNTTAVPQPLSKVYVNGSLRGDLDLVSVTTRGDAAGNQAVFAIPRARADTLTAWADGAEVVAYAYHDGGFQGRPVFRGWLNGKSGALDSKTDSLMLRADSAIARMDSVYLGQKDYMALVRFLRVNPETEQLNSWTLETILVYIFSTLFWPVGWASKVKLGSLLGLHTGRAGAVLQTDVVFTCATYREVIFQIMQLAGNVGVRERYEASATYLDFYPLGPDPVAARNVAIATLGDSVTGGSIVEALAPTWDFSGIYTRAIGYGAAAQMVVTLTDNHATFPLEPGWDGATYPGGTDDDPWVFEATEQAVLDNPLLAVPGSPEFDPAYARVFRTFKIPSILKNYTIESDLRVVGPDGGYLPIQAYIYGNTYETVTDAGLTKYRRVSGVDGDKIPWPIESIDPVAGEITFKQPVLVEREIYNDSTNALVVTMMPRPLGVTLCFSLDGYHLAYDTGVRGWAGPEGIGSDGLTFCFFRNDLKHVRLTSDGAGITSGGVEVVWPAVFHDGQQWRTYSAEYIYQDDSLQLIAITEAAFRERCMARRQTRVDVPFILSGVRVGDSLRITTANDSHVTQIQSITISASTGHTVMMCSDQVPNVVAVAGADAYTLPRIPHHLPGTQYPLAGDYVGGALPGMADGFAAMGQGHLAAARGTAGTLSRMFGPLSGRAAPLPAGDPPHYEPETRDTRPPLTDWEMY